MLRKSIIALVGGFTAGYLIAGAPVFAGAITSSPAPQTSATYFQVGVLDGGSGRMEHLAVGILDAGVVLTQSVIIDGGAGPLLQLRNVGSTQQEWRFYQGGAGNFDGYLKLGVGNFGNNWAMAWDSDSIVYARVAVSSPQFRSNLTGVGETAISQWTNTGGSFNGIMDLGPVYGSGNKSVRNHISGTGSWFVHAYTADVDVVTIAASGKMTFVSGDETGTPGAATINQPSFRVAIAAAAAAVTVTNSLISATSIVLCELQTNDGTATSIKSVVPGSGTVTINTVAAATGTTNVGCVVFN